MLDRVSGGVPAERGAFSSELGFHGIEFIRGVQFGLDQESASIGPGVRLAFSAVLFEHDAV